MLRIISGKHKNRLIPLVKNATYRPSTNKLREAVFSILVSLEHQGHGVLHDDTDVLDVFAGTGSFAFEALSRGVRSITLVDIEPLYLKSAQDFAAKINEIHSSFFLKMNALNLPVAFKKYGLVFLDPPYYKNMASQALVSLQRGNWLLDGGIIIVEMAKSENLVLEDNIEIVFQRVYGNNQIMVLRYNK